MELGFAVVLRRVRSALVTRYLFDNWYLLLGRYALSKLGFNVKLIASIDNCIFELSPKLLGLLIRSASRRLIDSISCQDNRLVINGIEISDINDMMFKPEILARVLGWKYDVICGCWVKANVKFKHIYGIPYILDFQEYGSLKVNGKLVIDIGAFVGDSAIYFALRGARKVIAVEPHPEAYNEMLENIRLNNLNNVIIPVNAGLASKPGKLCIENVSVEDTIVRYYKPGECNNTVPAITLGELISNYSIDDDNILLKMDCEGCEHDIILNDYEHIKQIKELVFEYHANIAGKPLSELLKILNRDFRCNFTEKDRLIFCARK
ncbi:MAG: FkbM family methyltransferase [Acidilobaceae archaeon]|jgi:FkbM family methyltransferase